MRAVRWGWTRDFACALLHIRARNAVARAVLDRATNSARRIPRDEIRATESVAFAPGGVASERICARRIVLAPLPNDRPVQRNLRVDLEPELEDSPRSSRPSRSGYGPERPRRDPVARPRRKEGAPDRSRRACALGRSSRPRGPTPAFRVQVELGFTASRFEFALDECLAKYEGASDDVSACVRAAVWELSRSDRSDEACVRAVVAVAVRAARARRDVRAACNAARVFGEWLRVVDERGRRCGSAGRVGARVPSAVSLSRWRRVALACAHAFPALVDAMARMPPDVRRATARAWAESGLRDAVELAVAAPGACRACLGTGWDDVTARAYHPVHCESAREACASYSLTTHLVTGVRPACATSASTAILDAAIAEYARGPSAARVLELAMEASYANATGDPSAVRDARTAAFAVATAGHVEAATRVAAEVEGRSMDEYVRVGGARVSVPSDAEAKLLCRAIAVGDGAVVASLVEELEGWGALERALGLDYGDCLHYHALSVDWEWRRSFA